MIDDYLIMPMQRIPRYVLLLQQLQKHTHKDDPSYQSNLFIFYLFIYLLFYLFNIFIFIFQKRYQTR